MFDIGPSELLIIFVVALLVIGPERLPTTVKTVSLWIGRFRRSFHKIKAEVERELNADEIRRQLHNESILAEVEDAKKQAQDFKKEVEKSATPKQIAEETDQGLEADTAEKPEKNPGKTEKKSETIGAAVGKDLSQAVDYVNDISREVKASKEEVEQEFSKPASPKQSGSSEKS